MQLFTIAAAAAAATTTTTTPTTTKVDFWTECGPAVFLILKMASETIKAVTFILNVTSETEVAVYTHFKAGIGCKGGSLFSMLKWQVTQM